MKLIIGIVLVVLVFQVHSLEGEIQPIRAVDFLGRGFDLYTGEYLVEGEKKPVPIFDFTYGKKVWRYPGSDTPYAIPTEIAVAANPFVKEIVLQSTYTSYRSYLSNYSSWFHFGVDFQYGAFQGGLKYNQELGKIHSEMTEKNKDLMTGYHRLNIYSASLYMPEILDLDPAFIKSLAVLPDRITDEDSELKYRHFVQTYGTHYVFSALFGAKLNFDAMTSSELQDHYEKKWVNREYGLYFHYQMFNISNGGYQNRSSIQVSTDFIKQTQSESFFYGGDPGQAHVDSIKNWTQTINGFEYPFNVTLNEISELIPDKTKRLTMKAYVTDYINRNSKPKKRNIVDEDVESPICLGKGFDPLTMKCVGQALDLTSGKNPVFRQEFPESFDISYQTFMTKQFDGSMWYHTYSKSDVFLGFGKKTKECYAYYENHLLRKKAYDVRFATIAYERHSMAVLQNAKLTRQLEASIAALPRVYDKLDPEVKLKYFHFLQANGYAFVDDVHLGGHMKMENFIDMSYVNTKDINWVKEQSSWSILNIIKSKYDVKFFSEHLDKDFNAASQPSYMFVGGDTTMTNYTEWKVTVKNNMAPVKFNLQPITSIIGDKILAANLDAAYIDYVKEADYETKTYMADLN
jgi:hypothetical protein